MHDVERFWSHVAVSDDDACWLWRRTTDTSGYGSVHFEGRMQSAHRIAYRLCVGNIPQGLCVLHTCDVRRCCNPRHLWLGTRADNNADMLAKGRARYVNAPYGERVGGAKLTAASALAIRVRASEGEGGAALAREFAVSPATVCEIAKGRKWAKAIAELEASYA